MTIPIDRELRRAKHLVRHGNVDAHPIASALWAGLPLVPDPCRQFCRTSVQACRARSA